jgi:branched-chain amino acid transport system substrate-binding protein
LEQRLDMTIFRRLFIAVITLALITGAYWAYKQLRPNKIVVAVDAPLVNKRVFDPSDMDAARLYFEETPNSRMKLQEMFYDFNPADSATGFQAAIDEGVRFFVTTQPSSTLVASSHLFAESGPLLINTSATSPTMTAKDDLMIRIIADAQQEQQAIANYINGLPGQRLLVLQDSSNAAYTDPAFRFFVKQLGTRSRWHVTQEKFSFEHFRPSDFNELLTQPFDALYVLGGDFQPNIGNLLQLFYQHHRSAPIVLTPWARSNAIFEMAGPAIDNIVLISHFPAKAQDPAINDYLNRFRQRFGYQPLAMALLVRQALEILEQAMAAGNENPDRVKSYLLSRERLQTSLGEIKLDDMGDMQQIFYPIGNLGLELQVQ